ncbi:MAG: hypothetical protein NC048_10370, partial [Bacteroides sp.]|nr:hypothetical protein [Bacteroides sp.]
MPATEIYRTVLSAVVAESEIPESKILSACKERDAVDARYVLVYVLYRIGFSSNRIERHTSVNLRSIQYIITYYEQR